MVGNSSSGIIEAPSFRLPVVNIGTRQAGRVYMQNVIHCTPNADDIHQALQRALTPEFRETLQDLKNRYGDGQAGERIVEKLAAVDLARLIPKKFVDTPR
jgi:UDP-N-acetylglucosamine 2-epimerase (non-hydrolysing)